MTELRADFDIAATEVSNNIEALRGKLFIEVSRFDLKIPEKHEGPEYREAVLAFTRQINSLEKRHAKDIQQIASQISALADQGWESSQDIVRLWHDFAIALTAFSEHPSKKVATVIVSDDNKLQAYGTNRIPPNIVKRAEHFIRGLRSAFFVCSERMAFISYYKLSIKPWWSLKKYPRRVIDEIEHKEIGLLSKRADEIGEHSPELRKSTLITTTTPCDVCAKSIVMHWPKALITNGKSGHNFSRSGTFAEGESLMRQRGITLTKLEC